MGLVPQVCSSDQQHQPHCELVRNANFNGCICPALSACLGVGPRKCSTSQFLPVAALGTTLKPQGPSWASSTLCCSAQARDPWAAQAAFPGRPGSRRLHPEVDQVAGSGVNVSTSFSVKPSLLVSRSSLQGPFCPVPCVHKLLSPALFWQ